MTNDWLKEKYGPHAAINWKVLNEVPPAATSKAPVAAKVPTPAPKAKITVPVEEDDDEELELNDEDLEACARVEKEWIEKSNPPSEAN